MMVKWIRVTVFVARVRTLGEDEGGNSADHEYFSELANI
jgi:hypothetical protein